MSATPVESAPVRLSPREREVAALVAEGLTNRDIAKRLFISERTVDGHLEHVREKLAVNSRSQIATWFVRQETPSAAVATPAEPVILPAPGARLMAHPRIWVATALVLAMLAAGVGLLRLTAPALPTIKTIAGSAPSSDSIGGGGGYTGDGAFATNARLNRPSDIVVASDGTIYIADYGNGVVRRVTANGTITSYTGDITKPPAADGEIADTVSFGYPSNLAIDSGGNLYILTDLAGMLEVWKVRRDRFISRVVTVGPTTTTNLYKTPLGGLVVADDGALYIADRLHNRVWKFADGSKSPYAGTGETGFSGDGGAALDAKLDWPTGLALDKHGNLYIADTENNRIRKVDTLGTITTIAGDGRPGDSGDGGPAIEARLSLPFGVAVAADGTLVIADYGNNRLREVTPSHQMLALAGTKQGGFAGDNLPAITAQLSAPEGVAFDANGDLFVADTGNHRVREIARLVPSK
jgi:DNA-binding CsgD family transcriptional regulator/sugar lactone lactonase YvrE